jgi:8-amino-7-oxononanoate synthase
LVSFCSNDYLGLSTHPSLQSAVATAVSRFGFGAGAARLVSGTFSEHLALEEELAALVHMPAAVLYSSGYLANLGVFSALAGPEDLIVVDHSVHASIIDGCRLSRAKLAVYPHLNFTIAEKHLSRLSSKARRRFLVTESLFSMDGDFAPLPQLAAMAAHYQAAFIVDEAHALGILGPSGAGLSALSGVRPDIVVGTLGKALGACGAFVASTVQLCQYLTNRSRPFIYNTALPPLVAAAARAAVRLLRSAEGDALRDQLLASTSTLRTALGLTPQPSPIIPIVLGSDANALLAANHLKARGFYVQAIRPPTVPEDTARLRLTVSSQHTVQQIADLLKALAAYPIPR